MPLGAARKLDNCTFRWLSFNCKKERLPEAVSLPFASFDVIAETVQQLSAIIFALMNLDEHQHKLYDTDQKTCDPDNNRNHCQSVQAFTSSYIKIWQKAKPTAPFWVAMFVSKLLSLTYKHQNCRKHLKSQELFQTFFCGFAPNC